MNKMGSSYPGGKGAPGVCQNIINKMPPHDVYIEAFLGSGVVMKTKRPARYNIGIDLDRRAVEAFDGAPVPFLELHCADAVEFLRDYVCRGRVLVYVDPPYLGSTRSSLRRYYKYEMLSDRSHMRLLGVLKRLPAMVMISSYENELYRRELEGWSVSKYFTVNRAGDRVAELIWMNFKAPSELHDYRFLGDTFRERERISRLRARWVKRLSRMPVLERQAVLSDLMGVRS